MIQKVSNLKLIYLFEKKRVKTGIVTNINNSAEIFFSGLGISPANYKVHELLINLFPEP